MEVLEGQMARRRLLKALVRFCAWLVKEVTAPYTTPSKPGMVISGTTSTPMTKVKAYASWMLTDVKTTHQPFLKASK